MSWVRHSISSSARNLGGLRGFVSVHHGDHGGTSPRIRKLRIEDLLPPVDPSATHPLGEPGFGTKSWKAVRFGRASVRSSLASVHDGQWYQCFCNHTFLVLLWLIVGIASSIGLAVFLWEYRQPECAEGAFGKLAQNIRPESVQEANFVKARVRAVSGPTLLAGLGLTDETSLETLEKGFADTGNETVLGAARGFQWRRVELIYQVQQGAIVSLSSLASAKTFENKLKDMVGWKKLCSERVPKAAQHYCDRGDSLPAVAYANQTVARGPELAEGVLYESTFDGRGSASIMPLPTLMDYLVHTHPEVFMRWFKINDPTKNPATVSTAMRTMFSFYLPTEHLGEWDEFRKTLEPTLKAAAKRGIGSATLHYRGDGLDLEEDFNYAVDNALIWACIAGFGTLFSVVAVTRRLFLGCATLLLAGAASATASSAMSVWHEDGFVEFPAVAITTWFINVANSADLAISCVSSWHLNDPFPTTAFGEACRHLAAKLEACIVSSRKSKLSVLCSWLMQIFVWIINKSFPPRSFESPDETPLTDWHDLGCMYWFLVNLLLPPMVTGSVFLLIAVQTELLLLQEFSYHAGAGLIISSLYAVLLYPPVIDFGDILHEKSQKCQAPRWLPGCLRRRIENIPKCPILPVEMGADPEWMNSRRGAIEMFALMLNQRPMRALALLLSVGVIVGFTFSEFASAFVPTAPMLFPVGHRSREGPKVRELFGQLPRNLEAPEPTLSGARKCKADASENATCSWFQCETKQRTLPDPGNCRCMRRWGNWSDGGTTRTTTITTTTHNASSSSASSMSSQARPSCSAVARVAGLSSHQKFPQFEFWKWAEEQLGVTLGDDSNQVTEPQRIGELEMEDWATGDSKVSKQFKISLQAENQDMPKFEDACVSLMCYCDVSSCDLGPEWADLGQVLYTEVVTTVTVTTTMAGAIGGRRLEAETNSMTAPQYSPMLRHPLRGYHRRLAEEQVKVATEMVDINIIWGLHRSEQIPFRTSSIDLKFDEGFMMEDPWAQRSIASFCEGVAPDLRIVSTQCWVIDFKRWLAGQGETYPTRPLKFYSRFVKFSMYRSTHEAASIHEGGGASGGTGYDYFWLAETGHIRGTFATFKVDAPTANQSSAVADLLQRWTSYVTERNGMSRSTPAWMASPLFAQAQTAEIVRNSCYLAVGSLLAVSCTTMLVLTCSLGITVAYTVVLMLSMCTFASFWTGLGSTDIGSMEIVSLSVFLTFITIPLIRVANGYSYARDRPHLPAEMMMEAENDDSNALGRNQKRPAMTRDDLQALSKQLAEDMGEGEILMFPGAIAIERQSRVATALQRGGAAAMGLSLAAVISGVALVPLEMEALAQVGLSILCFGCSVPAAIGLLVLLLLLGLGDSKARSHAFRELGRYTWGRLAGKVHDEGMGLLDGRSEEHKLGRRPSNASAPVTGTQAVVASFTASGTKTFVASPSAAGSGTPASWRPAREQKKEKPHMVAAMMLGAPRRITTKSEKKPLAAGTAATSEDMLKQAADDVGDEAGPCILTLDVQGATAKPPYHVVLATRDVINMKG